MVIFVPVLTQIPQEGFIRSLKINNEIQKNHIFGIA
jgi:hypothetical protein